MPERWSDLYQQVNDERVRDRALAEQREQSLRELAEWREAAVDQMIGDLRAAAERRARDFEKATALTVNVGQPSSVPKGHGHAAGIFLSWMPVTLEYASVGVYVTASPSGKTLVYLAYPATPLRAAKERHANQGLVGVRLVSRCLCQVVPRSGHAPGQRFEGYRLLKQQEQGNGETSFDAVIYEIFRELTELWRFRARSSAEGRLPKVAP